MSVEPNIPPPPPSDAPPPGGDPEPKLIDGLGSVAVSPATLRTMFVMLTRAHFSDANNYGPFKDKMSKFVWSKAEKPGLFIDFDFNYDPKQIDRRPAIYIGTSDFDYTKVANTNFKATSEDRSAEQFAKRTATNVIIRHLGGSAMDSWILATLSEQFFMGIQTLMMERVRLQSYEVVKMMASRPFERASQQADPEFIVDLIINVTYSTVWLITRESHRIKTVGFAQSLTDLSCSTDNPQTKS